MSTESWFLTLWKRGRNKQHWTIMYRGGIRKTNGKGKVRDLWYLILCGKQIKDTFIYILWIVIFLWWKWGFLEASKGGRKEPTGQINIYSGTSKCLFCRVSLPCSNFPVNFGINWKLPSWVHFTLYNYFVYVSRTSFSNNCTKYSGLFCQKSEKKLSDKKVRILIMGGK